MLCAQKYPATLSTGARRVSMTTCRPVAHIRRRVQHRDGQTGAVPAVICASQKKSEETGVSNVGSPLVWPKTVALFAAAVLLTSFGQVDDAMAARSGGRVGGSSFSSARMRSGGARSAPSVSSGGVRNYNYYSAPPLISPYGGYGMFGGGLVMPFPVFGLGGLFNIMVLLFMVNVAVSVVQGLTNGGRDGRGKDDRWDDGEDDRW